MRVLLPFLARVTFCFFCSISNYLFASEYWFPGTNTAAQYPSAQQACSYGYPGTDKVYGVDYIGPTTMETRCWWKGANESGTGWTVIGNAYRVIVEDPPPPPDDPCAANAGQPVTWRAEYESIADHDSNPIRCTTSQNGCSVDICSDNGTKECHQDASTGKFVCTGTGYETGETLNPSDVGEVDSCQESNCDIPPPTSSDSGTSCTAPAVNAGTTSYTCVTESNANQWASSNCAVGDVSGVTALHCTKPDYVPESDKKKVTDNITETTNPDGSTTKTKVSTTERTTCKAGVCTTTTTTTTTTGGSSSSGAPLPESIQCTGDRCDNPATPEDESEPEEEEERTVSGEGCSSDLSCDGDAIDCAILRQQKEMNCALDWNTQKGEVLAEASKSEYQLKTDEIDASALFSGPSASRWLVSSCPADASIYLETIGQSVTISWAPICNYADIFGYLFVFSASLFFAVYVGRSFGG